MKKSMIALSMLAAFGTTSSALAFFHVDDTKPVPPPMIAKATPNAESSHGTATTRPLLDPKEWRDVDALPNIKEIGFGKAKVVKGSGSNMKLSDALRLLVPKGWKVYTHNNVSEAEVISWSGGRPWTEVLSRIGTNHGYEYRVHWDSKTVTARRASTMDAKPASKDNTPKNTYFGITKYMVYKGELLSNELARWAKTEGWNLHWGISEDYPVAFDTEFDGKTIVEAVQNVVKAYQTRGGMPGVIAVHSEANHVVSIEYMK
ncbi:MAG: TcpQ domain-containing protein [Chromatiales bacterium]